MSDNEEKVSAAIAEQAGERFVANDEGPLDDREALALAAWLKASPAHVEEFLGVSVIARDLKELQSDPDYSLDAVLGRARAEDTSTVAPLRPGARAGIRGVPARRWQSAAAAAMLLLGGVLVSWWTLKPSANVPVPGGTTVLHFETKRGEQITRRLADNTVLHLNTDSAVTIQFSRAERLVTLASGQAAFEVAHEPARAFRVLAGGAEVVAVGTQFDVRLENDATVVTVVEGRVAVGPSLNDAHSPRFVELGANQQLRLVAGEWPPTVLAVDAQPPTAWLHRQIAFDHEPLERVAAEFNRYAAKPFAITTPALKSLQISGVFRIDDPEAFIAFLRSLQGVRVEVTATQILVSGD